MDTFYYFLVREIATPVHINSYIVESFISLKDGERPDRAWPIDAPSPASRACWHVH